MNRLPRPVLILLITLFLAADSLIVFLVVSHRDKALSTPVQAREPAQSQ